MTYFGQDYELRCVGAKFSDMTFLTSTAPDSVSSAHEILHQELMRRFREYSTYPSALNPADSKWWAGGPFFQVAWLTLDMPYSSYYGWSSGTIPAAVSAALKRPGSFVRSLRRPDGSTNLIVNDPGTSISLLSPPAGGFSLQDADGQWRPANEVLAPNEVPAADRMVRTKVQVVVAAVLFGDIDVNGQNQRYLGDDAIARLRGIPGVATTDALQLVWQNW